MTNQDEWRTMIIIMELMDRLNIKTLNINADMYTKLCDKYNGSLIIQNDLDNKCIHVEIKEEE